MQEFLVCPSGAKTVLDALAANASVHREIGAELRRRDPTFTSGRGDEGAWAPRVSDDEALEVVAEIAEKVAGSLGMNISLGLDIASSSLWDEKTQRYVYSRRGKRRDSQDQLQYVLDLIKRYNLIYVEDPLHEEAFDEFAELTKKVSGCYITGDDLFVTSPARLLKASTIHAANAAILKVNQVGTLADALDFARVAEEKGYSIITSHRSGETPGAHIADVAIATGSKMLKSGVVGGERVDKLNRLLRITEAENCRMVKLTA
jgi:enolase